MKTESFKSILAKAVLSGVMIGVGGIVYMVVDNKYLGGLMFGFLLMLYWKKKRRLFNQNTWF